MQIEILAVLEVVREDRQRQWVARPDREVARDLASYQYALRIGRQPLWALACQHTRRLCHRRQVRGQIERKDRLAVAADAGRNESEGADGIDGGSERRQREAWVAWCQAQVGSNRSL